MRTLLSPRELASAIGVSESSLKRWVDEGRLQALRTAGGHRRIALSEAVRFIRETRATVVRPDVLGLPGGAESLPERGADFPAALQGDDPVVARAMMVGMFVGGLSTAALADGPIQSAMESLAEAWRRGPRGILAQQRATDTLLAGVNMVRGLLPLPAHGAPVALGCAPADDHHCVPSLIAATVLQEVGYRTVNLGPDTAIAVLLDGIELYRPRLVWTAFTSPTTKPKLDQWVRAVAPAAEAHGGQLVITGRAIESLPAPPGAHVGMLMSDLAAFAKGLAATGPAETAPPPRQK